MPHTCASSWATFEAHSVTTRCNSAQYGKGGVGVKLYSINNDNICNHNHNQPVRRSSTPVTPGRHMRTRSISIIEDLENLPLVLPKEKQVVVTVKSTGRKDMPPKALAIQPPASLLSWLPCMPSSTYNPRNELQRRASPTSKSFGPTFPASPPLTPLTPAGAQSFLTKHHSNFSTPLFGAMEEEQVYVLTLKTSEEIAQQMQALRQRWFPAHRLKVPAHVTLFHALPESKLPQVEKEILQLTSRTSQFDVSAGRVMRMRKGVMVTLENGDWDVRILYGRLQTAFIDWLSEQDKSCKAHWTIQNKEEDQNRVEAAFEDTRSNATSSGLALGLVLWRYGEDGRWTKEKEYPFATAGSREVSPTR